MSGAKATPIAVPLAIRLGLLASGPLLPLLAAGGAIIGTAALIRKLTGQNRMRRADLHADERMEETRRQAARDMDERLRSAASRRARREQDIKNLRDRLEGLGADQTRKLDAARDVLTNLSRIADELAKMPHERFMPGEMESIQRHITDAQKSLESGMPEASLSTAQRAYWEICDLRDLVEEWEREFMRIHQSALENARILLEEARSDRIYQIDVGEGEGKEVIDLDVDHWTKGELSGFEKQIEALIARLESGENTLTTDEVKEILNTIDTLEPRLQEIVARAVDNIIGSQVRQNIAESTLDALRDQGFELEDSTYEGDDERNSYVIKVKNIAGSEVVTVIAPSEQDAGSNVMTVNSYDETFVDEGTLVQRSREILSVLNQQGLETGDPQEVGHAMPEYRDIEQVRQRKLNEHPTGPEINL